MTSEVELLGHRSTFPVLSSRMWRWLHIGQHRQSSLTAGRPIGHSDHALQSLSSESEKGKQSINSSKSSQGSEHDAGPQGFDLHLKSLQWLNRLYAISTPNQIALSSFLIPPFYRNWNDCSLVWHRPPIHAARSLTSFSCCLNVTPWMRPTYADH